MVRLVRPDRRGADTFLEAADLTSRQIRTYPNGQASGSLAWIKLVPVTEVSVRAFYRETGHPPTPLFSVNDWADNFGSDGSFRIQPDQIDLISCTQAELGARTIGWSVGRSWVEYRSHLPQAKTFPCVLYEEAKKSPRYPRDDPYDYGPRIAMMNQYDPLEIAMESRRRCGVEVWPWLGMQRHYGVSFYGGLFACPFYRDNPRWWRSAKDGSHAAGVSFLFPEVRKERVDILLEVAGRGADGLVVGCDRQVPMLLYDPEIVEAYQARTGVDAHKIDASNGKAYEDWIRWRAGFFTELLRDLQRGLAPVRAKTGKAIPVAVRFPSAGLFFNLAQGLDVEQWCRERLVDQMQLDPLEELAGESRHDIRPYLELGRRYGVAVIGGIGSTGYLGDPNKRPAHVVPGLKRALGLLRAGVDGIDTYETNGVAFSYESRFIVPLFANVKRMEEFLRTSNLEACHPVDAGNAAAGHDNHSRWDRGWSVYGFAKNSF